MSLQTVKEYLRAWHKDGAVREFPVSSATVELAAAALQVEPARIAKTLSFLKGDGCLLLVAAGDARIDNTRFKAAFGCKAKMPERERVEVLTGHPVGGVCPFANPEGVASLSGRIATPVRHRIPRLWQRQFRHRADL